MPLSIDDLAARFEQYHANVQSETGKVKSDVATIKMEIETISEKVVSLQVGSVTDRQTGKNSAGRKAFAKLIRLGKQGLDENDIAALSVSSDQNGGFLAPQEYQNELIRDVVEFSPIRKAARVGVTANGEVKLPRRTGQPSGAWVGETEERPETGPTYGQLTIVICEFACYVDVSNQLLQDAAVDVAAELSFDLAEEFGRAEGEAFISGATPKRPLGILAFPGLSEKPSGHASQITADGMIDLLYALPAAYRARSTWLMNSTTIAAVRKLKDTTGQYLWQPALSAGQPETILGRPLIDAPDMPSIGAGNYPVVIGDIGTGYRIFDKQNGLSILRDPYSIATTGQTRFHAKFRVGGSVAQPNAFRKMKIGTS